MNPQIRRLALDLGPLFIFFAAFQFAGIFAATAIFMVAVLATLGASKIDTNKVQNRLTFSPKLNISN